MAKIFISYRRSDSQHAVDRLYRGLEKHVSDPRRDIFMDVDNIPLGVDFVEHLSGKVGECEILLAVIGKDWLGEIQRRKDDPKDFVRVEIEAALARGIPIVPILLDGAPVPREDELPPSITPLARRNGTELRRQTFDANVAALARGLNLGDVPTPSSAPVREPDKTKSTSPKEPRKGKVPFRLIIGGGLVVATAILFGVLGVQYFRGEPTRTDIVTVEPVSEDVSIAAGNDNPEEATSEVGVSRGIAIDNAADDAAWERAQEFATVAAYRAYLGNEDYTVHQAEALSALNRHEQAVLRLQTALNAKGFEAGTADGAVGGQTRAAVEAHRRARNFDISTVDLAAIDAAPISALATGVERWVRPAPARTITPSASTSTAPQATNAKRVGDSFRDQLSGGGQGPEMVVIPSGSFTMGSPANETGRHDDEIPQRSVRVDYQLSIGKYEVTWAEWEACVTDGGCEDNSNKKYSSAKSAGDAGFGRGNRPVINVDWNDAQAYVRWLTDSTGETYRLLSEAEWEYAARAGSADRWSFGDDESDLVSYGWYDSNSNSRTQPVGTKNANAFGLHDMQGNVYEWTQDCWNSSYSGAPRDGSVWESRDCSRRVLRGGSWYSISGNLRSAERYRRNASYRNYGVGFRVARTL